MDAEGGETRAKLFENIIVSAQRANAKLKSFGDEFVQGTLGADLEAHHRTWIDHRYHWLVSGPELPKNLFEDLDEDFLKKMEDQYALRLFDALCQKVAIMLEIVAYDFEEDGDEGNFAECFLESRDLISATENEIEFALRELRYHLPDVVTDNFVPGDVKSMEPGMSRKFRDWFVYRDASNVVEGVIQTFKHLKQKR